MVTKQFFQLTADVLKSLRPDRGDVTYMAAQAVRLQIREIIQKTGE